MIDAHVHIENGPYNEEWISRFLEFAQERKITELYLLEHSHRFLEFKPLYDDLYKDPRIGKYQKEWIDNRCVLNLDSYKNFIVNMQKTTFPIKIYFGLEICYFPEREEALKLITRDFKWDFLSGSVHWIDGWGFDHPKIMEEWKNRDTDSVYLRYYEIMGKLIASKLFNHLSHPDSIKCFYHYPSIQMNEIYRNIARQIKSNDMKVENSAGLHINYKHKELGLNEAFLRILKEEQVDIITASDAHKPEDVGLFIKELTDKP